MSSWSAQALSTIQTSTGPSLVPHLLLTKQRILYIFSADAAEYSHRLRLREL